MGKNFYDYIAGEKSAVITTVDSHNNSPKQDSPKVLKTSNFIDYLAGQNASREKCFEELSELVDFNNIDSVQKCFNAYLKENNPPGDILDVLQEEPLIITEENDRKKISVSYCFPGIEVDEEAFNIKQYLEGFLEDIGVDMGKEVVEYSFSDGANGAVCYVDLKFFSDEVT